MSRHEQPIDPYEATHDVPEPVYRYLLAKAPGGRSYLYDYAAVVDEVALVLVVAVAGEDEQVARFRAQYLNQRLASGLQSLCVQPFYEYEAARAAAVRLVALSGSGGSEP